MSYTDHNTSTSPRHPINPASEMCVACNEFIIQDAQTAMAATVNGLGLVSRCVLVAPKVWIIGTSQDASDPFKGLTLHHMPNTWLQ